ncbi:imm11 family protein [Labilibacter marinus]|uniref:imm11 family protein n=1 Tax=Labilibacter marinus TaxID=1477105 RepID=UPI0009500762|nr:hypothetical protein [Labilibacter marinus]
MKEELCNLSELQKDSEHKSMDGEVDAYGIVSLPVDETSIHVLLPGDKITWRTFPPKDFKLPNTFYEPEVKKEKDRDFLLSNLSADGFLVSAKTKSILEQFDLGNHKFYKSNIILEKGGFLKKAKKQEIFWLHLVLNDLKDDYVDFKNTIFKEKILKDGDIVGVNKIQFDSVDALYAYKKEKHDKWIEDSEINPFYEINAWDISLNSSASLPDILGFSRVDSGNYYFSKRLTIAIREAKLNGINISKTGKIKAGNNV